MTEAERLLNIALDNPQWKKIVAQCEEAAIKGEFYLSIPKPIDFHTAGKLRAEGFEVSEVFVRYPTDPSEFGRFQSTIIRWVKDGTLP